MADFDSGKTGSKDAYHVDPHVERNPRSPASSADVVGIAVGGQLFFAASARRRRRRRRIRAARLRQVNRKGLAVRPRVVAWPNNARRGVAGEDWASAVTTTREERESVGEKREKKREGVCASTWQPLYGCQSCNLVPELRILPSKPLQISLSPRFREIIFLRSILGEDWASAVTTTREERESVGEKREKKREGVCASTWQPLYGCQSCNLVPELRILPSKPLQISLSPRFREIILLRSILKFL
ncbi:hypothetical protein TorRG33x02_153330, partial [Trema orientale]